MPPDYEGRVAPIANDLATLFELSGYGCILKNLQFFDGKDKAEAGANLLVSGNRNYLENVFAAGMGDATGGAPATIADAGHLAGMGRHHSPCLSPARIAAAHSRRTAHLSQVQETTSGGVIFAAHRSRSPARAEEMAATRAA